MLGWLRGKGRADYQTPPQEPAGADLEAAIQGIDIRLGELSDDPTLVRDEAWWGEVDRLIERRSRLARPPSVPVNPGPSS